MVVCKADQEVNPKTGRCVKKCATGTVRNPATGRCIKGAAAVNQQAPPAAPFLPKQKSPSTKKKCMDGYEINPKTGRCIKKCAAGTIRNPATGRCVKGAAPAAPADAPAAAAPAHPAPKGCPKPDQEINPKTGRCVKKCAPGTIRNPATGKCESVGLKSPLAPSPIRDLSLATTAIVRQRALFLNTVCSDAGVCLAFGKEDDKIKRFFEGFSTFKYASPDIKRVGAVSNNGFVNMLEYEREGYKSHAILKSAIKPSVDNLYYEYLVGQYFINAQKRHFPCFVETYGLFQYKDNDTWKQMQEKTKNVPELNKYMYQLRRDDPDNVKRSCENSKYMSILIENIKNAETIGNMMKSLPFTNCDLLYVLFQVYAPLSHLADNFTHYDLHHSNVLTYRPFETNKYIEFHYHLKAGEPPITFKSEYIAKIIDYGRSYYRNDTATGNFHDRSEKILEKVCEPTECNTKQKCGNRVGYEWLYYPGTKAVHYISSKTNNISHDLRFIKIVQRYLSTVYTRPDFIKTGLFDKIVYKTEYGTPENRTPGKKGAIHNVHDALDAIVKCMKRAEITQLNNKCYENSDKVGDLHVYFDGRPMEFRASAGAHARARVIFLWYGNHWNSAHSGRPVSKFQNFP